MKKTLRTLIISFLIFLFFAFTITLVMAQNFPSPQVSPSVSQSASAPVVLGNKTLFNIQVPQGGLSVQQRAQRTSQRLRDFAYDRALPLEELEIYEGDRDGIPLTAINAGHFLIITLSNRDAQMAGKPRPELAKAYFQSIKEAVSRYRQERTPQYLFWATVWSVIATVILIVALLIANNVFARIYQRLKAWGETHIRPVRLGNWELIRANQLDNVIIGLARLVRIAIVLGLLAAYFAFVFRRFPWTKGWAKIFEGLLRETLTKAWQAFVAFLPNLLTIILVIVVTYFLLRLAKPFFRELEEGTFSLSGFYPEWAQPTYRIVTFLIIALAAVIAFPLLPGFQSPAFQGISVFLGLLISLGSSSVIANLVSGSVLIYTRAFRIGDHVKLGNVYGKVLEKTLLVTRVLTPNNVVVSIPNAQIGTSSIENYSFAYRELNKPYIMKGQVYLGYEVPWQEAYQALIEAAKRTKGMLQSPEPFVLQEELNAVYVTYLLNCYIDEEHFHNKTLKDFEQAHSQLHENIRDCCAEAGIRIFAPSYEIADPTHYGPAKH